MKLDNTRAMHHRASRVIAHGALTNSKRPESFVKGVYPTHLLAGKGCFVWDLDGNKYTDFICGLGSNLFGYANTDISNAVTERIQKGTVLSLGTGLEVQLGERLQGIFPVMERLRFLKTGSEACSAAIRIARAFTGRSLVISDGYHGWHDEFTSLTAPASGVPRNETKNITKLWEAGYLQFERAAAVIIEPVITDYSPKRLIELKELREQCTKYGALLIFDETITGLRFPGLSVTKWSGITPDLIVLGKALGGGYPLSCVGGRKDAMEADYFVSSTFAGDTIAMAACNRALDLLAGQYSIERLWDSGERFLTEFNKINPDIVRIDGYPTRGAFKGTEIGNGLFFQEAVKAGILFGKSWFWNFPLIDEADNVLSVCRAIINRILNNEVKLEGELPQTPFAELVRKK